MDSKPKLRKELMRYNQINKELNDVYDAFMRQEKMSHSEFDILYSLCELGEGCTQHEICSVSWLPKQTVNSSIRKLENKGLIRLMPGRGRERHIYPTKEGNEW
ncbi:MAG TPA: MarR family transcriptional regulator, partial [Lachnospiraceae bacterium]|nr:MarR family transcriptional regulator [Lachnospiraceae bacterium]